VAIQAYLRDTGETWISSTDMLKVGSLVTTKYMMSDTEVVAIVLGFLHRGDLSKVYYFSCETLDVRKC
jgi:hypothetical protein